MNKIIFGSDVVIQKNLGISGTVDFGNLTSFSSGITGDVTPTVTNQFSLGTTANQWSNLYLGNNINISGPTGFTGIASIASDATGVAYTTTGFTTPFINIGPETGLTGTAQMSIGGWNIGITGTRGTTGFDLVAQENSPAGLTGPVYSIVKQHGSTGPTGSQGLQGVTGATGTQGPVGSTGAQGAQGSVGVTGAQGDQGQTGATGAQGDQGQTGATGAQGTQGSVGATGAQGTQGSVGATGAQGGTRGPTGPTGPTGTSLLALTLNNDAGNKRLFFVGSSGSTSNTTAYSDDGSLYVANTNNLFLKKVLTTGTTPALNIDEAYGSTGVDPSRVWSIWAQDNLFRVYDSVGATSVFTVSYAKSALTVKNLVLSPTINTPSLLAGKLTVSVNSLSFSYHYISISQNITSIEFLNALTFGTIRILVYSTGSYTINNLSAGAFITNGAPVSLTNGEYCLLNIYVGSTKVFISYERYT